MLRLGVIGHPSDWLIASDVKYSEAKAVFDMNLIDIDIEELIDQINRTKEDLDPSKFNEKYDYNELNKAYKIYLAIKKIAKDYILDGLTIRCFDLLDTVKSTSCLAFALLNSEGIIAACEGDIPALISMMLIKKFTGLSSFQANPSKIDIEKNEIIFAHCTLPFDMCTSFKFDSHYESGIGVGIKGELKCSNVYIFRISNDLSRYVLLKGTIDENLNLPNLCRTQIRIKLDKANKVNYFLTKPLGNHHLIFYGENIEELRGFLKKSGLKEVK